MSSAHFHPLVDWGLGRSANPYGSPRDARSGAALQSWGFNPKVLVFRF